MENYKNKKEIVPEFNGLVIIIHCRYNIIYTHITYILIHNTHTYL